GKNRLFCGDVLVDDALHRAVRLQLFQGAVDGIQQLGVALGHADGVLFIGVLGVQDLQTGVGGHELLGGSVVDNDAVNLTIHQSLHSSQTVVVGGDVLLAEAAVLHGSGAVQVTGGAALHADHLAGHIIDRSNVGIFRHDNHLDAGGVGVAEVHDEIGRAACRSG